MPLKAITKNEEEAFSWKLDKSIHKDTDFYCPYCGDEMIPIFPKKNIIQHFRHKNNEAHGEPETKEHLALKKRIYEEIKAHCNKKDIVVELEEKIKSRFEKKFADIYVTDGIKALVIECQCSPISYEEMKERNKFYVKRKSYNKNKSRDIYWVLGGKYFQNTQETYKRTGRNGDFEVQRISKIEKFLLNSGGIPPLHFDYKNSKFYTITYNYKERRGKGGKCKYLGWYNLKPRKFSKILESKMGSFYE